MDISTLTPEQLAALEAQLEAKRQAEKERTNAERAQYKLLVEDAVASQIKELGILSSVLSVAKDKVYGTFETLIKMKNELYGARSRQMTHTFSDSNGNSITIGYRTIDAFDNTLDMGITKVREYIDSLAVDENTAKLVEMINRLLKKDAKGNLKPSRILDLQNLADDVKNELLTEGVTIIRESYKPERSSIFIEAVTVSTIGKKVGIPLSITSADFTKDYTPDLSVFTDN